MSAFSPKREIGLGLAAYVVYLLARYVALRRGRPRAKQNAGLILAAERRLGLGIESRLQRFVLRRPGQAQVLSLGYLVLNVGLSVGWLAVLYRRRDPAYHRLRTACVLAFLGAQPVFVLFPAEPPRTLGELVDALSVSGVDLDHPLLVRFYNPVAAMPSLHVALATVTGGAAAVHVQASWARPLTRAYAPLVALVVTASGNHYVLDCVAGAALGAVARRLA